MRFKFNKKNILFAFFVTYLLIVIFDLVSFFFNPKVYFVSDTISFMTGAEILKDKKAEFLYDKDLQFNYQKKIIFPETRSWLLPFRSPPVIAIALMPLTYLGLKLSYILMIVFSLLNILLFSFIGFGLFKNLNRAAIFAISLFYFPFLATVKYGQFTSFLLLVLLLIYKFTKESKWMLAGLACGILLIKPQLFLLVPYLFFSIAEKKEFLKGVFLSVSIMLLANLLIIGPGVLFDYPKFLMETESFTYGSRSYQAFTLFAAAKLFSGKYISSWLLILINFTFYFMSILVFKNYTNKLSFEKKFILGIILTILFSVHALSHDLVILLIPIFILLNLILKDIKNIPTYYLFFLIFLFIIPLFVLINSAFIGVVLLIILVLMLFKPEDYLGKRSSSISPTVM